MTKLYDVESVPRGDPSNSHSMMLELVGPDRRVLDVGCATGYLARGLVEQGCTVSGVDNDPAAVDKASEVLERGVVADLETVDLVETFGEHSFDVVVFGDVLEHLRSPAGVLRQARRLLGPGGFVVLSIPNVAHGDVRLALLDGAWDYRPLGLLDDTHLRFFTAASVRRLLAESGLAPLETRMTRAPLFGTELGLREADFPTDLVARLRADPDHDVYQFVLQAVPADADGAVARLVAKEAELVRRVTDLDRQLVDARQRFAPAAAEMSDMQAGIARSHERETELRRELEATLATRTFRWSTGVRGVYGGLRRWRG